MQTAHELFIHELQDMLDAEQQLVEALGEQAEESSRPDLQKAFQSHQAQTQKQVERLQQVFESIGEEAEEVECKGIRGLIEEHNHFKEEEDPAEDIMDIFNVGAARMALSVGAELGNMTEGWWMPALSVPDSQVPVLVVDKKQPLKNWLQSVAGRPLVFHTVHVGHPDDVVLKPFYQIYYDRYTVCWKVLASEP